MAKISVSAWFLVLSIIPLLSFSNHYTSPRSSDSVTFLENEPKLDGVIYNDILALPVRTFNTSEATDETCPKPQACYRLAFGIGFFYIMIEYDAESITYRDRAYQNGDGFIVTIAKPLQNNQPADEFYVLGFSPGDNLSNSKSKQFIWYRNIDLSFQPLKTTKFCSTVLNNKIYLQALVYWNELYPFHPALSDGIGFNLCFVKACGENDKIYYFDVYDNNIQSEQRRREYEVLKFSKPHGLTLPQLYCILSRNYVTKKDELNLIASCIGKPLGIVTLLVSIRAEDNSYSQTDDYSIYNAKGCTKIFFDIPLSKLPFKSYILKWEAGAYSSGTIKFTVLPEFNREKLQSQAEAAKEHISPGSFATINFMLDDISARLENIKIYDSCPVILKDMTDMMVYLSCAQKDIDTLTKKEGVFRRGFFSNYDDTYRPYSVRIPAKFNRFKQYPLLVYLHGSGDDDRVFSKSSAFTKGDFIELYPNGRGTSNVFSTPESQTDIMEAIKDVTANYPIDTSCIILAGFSMGGYGVYRTFYEHPEVYKALAVFSGHPNLANQWLGDGHPDFLQEKYLEKFKGIKIFIFHGTEDMNCPFELTSQLAEKLREAGAVVEFVTEATGHSSPSEESYKLFLNWLNLAAGLKRDSN